MKEKCQKNEIMELQNKTKADREWIDMQRKLNDEESNHSDGPQRIEPNTQKTQIKF